MRGSAALDIVDRVPFGIIERRIAKALSVRFGCWVQTRALINAAYWDRPDGGPSDAKGSVKQHIHHIRLKLAPHGLTIVGRAFVGRRMESAE